MLSLDPKKLAETSIPVGMGWLLGSCMEGRPAKSDLVRQTVLAQVEKFTLADLVAQLPAASPQLIKKILAELEKTGKVHLVGRGRGARWEVVL